MIHPNILLIDKNYIYSSSTIFNNVDFDKQVKNSIYPAQQFILNIIGSGLYSEIQTQCSLSTYSANNQFLMSEFILPYLLNMVIYKMIIRLHYKLSPTGVQLIYAQHMNAPISWYNAVQLSFSKDGTKFSYCIYDTLSHNSSVLLLDFERRCSK